MGALAQVSRVRRKETTVASVGSTNHGLTPETLVEVPVATLNRDGSVVGKQVLVKIGQAAEAYGVCRTILRAAIRRGEVLAYRCGPLGKYRISKDSLESWIGMNAESDRKEKSSVVGRTVVYCRRSCQGVNDRDALGRQVEDVVGWCVRELKALPESVIVIKEQVSGMLVDWKSRPGLRRVWELVKEGTISRVVIKNKTRLARLPGATDLLEQHFADYGVSLIEAFPDADDDADGELNDDIQMFMSLATVICNRRSGLRGGFKKKVTIGDEVGKQLYKWQAQGKTLDEIVALAKENRFVGTKFDGSEVPFSRNTIWRFLAKAAPTTTNTPTLTDKDKLIASFANTHLRKAKGEFVTLHDVYQRYCQFAREQGAAPASPKHTIGQLRIRGWQKQRRTKARRWYFVDAKLTD